MNNTDNTGELQCTPGEWEIRGNHIFVKDKTNRVATYMVQHGWDTRTFEKIEDVEQLANLNICLAAKPMYLHLQKRRQNILNFLSLAHTVDEIDEEMASIYYDELKEVEAIMRLANKNLKP